MRAPEKLRVVVHQVELTHYRVPVFRELARARGVELTVACGGCGDQTPAVAPDDFKTVRCPSYRVPVPGRPATWETGQWRYASRRFTDVVVLPWNLNILSLIPALLRARANDVGSVLWGHGYSKNELPWRRYLRNAATALADVVVVYNKATAEALGRRGRQGKEVFVALNALDQTPIRQARTPWLRSPERLEAFRREHKLHGRFVVLFVSRLQADNRLDWLVEALGLLRSTHPAILAVVIGDGREEGDRIRSLANKLGVADRIVLLPGEYDEDRLAPWFMSASVFCYPRNVGLSLLHAFGHSLPVVTSNAIEKQGPEIEALVPDENGCLFEDGSPGDLSKVLQDLAADLDRLTRLGLEAHRTVAERFTLTGMVDGLLSAIRASAERAATRRSSGGRE